VGGPPKRRVHCEKKKKRSGKTGEKIACLRTNKSIESKKEIRFIATEDGQKLNSENPEP